MYMFGGGSIIWYLYGIVLVLGFEVVFDCLYWVDRIRLIEISVNVIIL